MTAGSPTKQSHKVDSADLNALGKIDIRFHGCTPTCCGVNWRREKPETY